VASDAAQNTEMASPYPRPLPVKGEGVATNQATPAQTQNLMTSQPQSQVSPLKGGRGGHTASAVKNVSAPARETSGPKYCVPLSRSQLSCLLRSESLLSQRRINFLVLHCSDTRPDQDFTVEALQRCHAQRGFGRYPGYHIYIRRDGTCYYTRPISLRGCHVKGYNSFSIGVCYEGGHKALTAPPTAPPPTLPGEGAAKAIQSPSLSQCERPRMAVHEELLKCERTAVHEGSHGAVHEELLKRGGGYTPVPYGTSGKYEDNRTEAQKLALREVFRTLHELFPKAKIVGHNEFGVAKACPCLGKENMDTFRAEIVGN